MSAKQDLYYIANIQDKFQTITQRTKYVSRILVEHEHGEEVDRDEETVNTCREKSEPHEELLGEGLELP